MKQFLFVILAFIVACAPAQAISLNEKNAGHSVTAHVNDDIVISLSGNATTGYGWKFSSPEEESFEVIKDTYEPNSHPQGMVGVGGQHIYEIKPLKTGVINIIARYYRPWETFDPQKDEQLDFIIEVK